MNPYSQELQTTAKALMSAGKGILAMENNGTCNRRFEKLGIAPTVENRQDYRELILMTPNLDIYISGAILLDETIRQSTSTGESIVSVMKRVGIIPGIKVDANEFVTEGLDDLAARISEYYRLGARFAKCRAVINIGADIPSTASIEANAQALARAAAICQADGLVPIVEPKVSMEGNHTLDRSQVVTAATLKELFNQLSIQGVAFDRMILNPSLVMTGFSAALPAPVNEIAMVTMETLMLEVPPTVAGITFLSGGQTKEQASAYRNAINVLFRQAPWIVTFFNARAIHQSALEQWREDSANTSAAQKSLAHRAGNNIIHIANRERKLSVI